MGWRDWFRSPMTPTMNLTGETEAICVTPYIRPPTLGLPIPEIHECPQCKVRGFKFRRRHSVYTSGCIDCGSDRATTWFFEDNGLLHHSYSFCPDCLRTDHTRCHSSTMIFTGSREMAGKWMKEQLNRGEYPTLEQTSPNGKWNSREA